jgi:hypothetical protein
MFWIFGVPIIGVLIFVAGIIVGFERESRTGVVMMALGIGIILAWGVGMIIRSNNNQDDCEAAGGVPVRGYERYVCVDRDVVIVP